MNSTASKLFSISSFFSLSVSFLIILFCLLVLSGCSIIIPSIPENPDEEKFSQQYREPDFSQEEKDLLNNVK